MTWGPPVWFNGGMSTDTQSNEEMAYLVRDAILSELDRRGIEYHGFATVEVWGVSRMADLTVRIADRKFLFRVSSEEAS